MIDEILITTDKNKIDLDKLIAYFHNDSYWAKDRKKETVIKSIANSICYSIFCNNEFIGFARIVTDHCTIAYFCDVFIINEYKGRGFGKKLFDYIMNDEEIKETHKLLMTRDAHSFYSKYGFENTEAIKQNVMWKK